MRCSERPFASRPLLAQGPRRSLPSLSLGSFGKNTMKTIILASIAAATVASASVIADGRGFFPVIVQVVDADSGTPIKSAKVRLEDAGTYREVELDPKRQTKILPDSLGKPVTTNTEGVAVVFGYGGWSSTTVDGKSTFSRSIAGTVIVEYDGKEVYRSTLKAWVEKNNFTAKSNSAPWIVVSLPAAE
jgi:hypothetical protein